MKVLVGLGNPGRQYSKTKHNFGFWIVDSFLKEGSLTLQAGKGDYHYLKTNDYYLVKPMSYMNNSGKALLQFINYYKINIDDLLVIYDDMDLDLGRLRIRAEGSAGGHNGVRSIISHLGTQRFSRLRLGIGKGFNEGIGHVLGKFCQDERSELEKTIKEAVLAIGFIAEKGISAARTKFYASPKAT